MNKRIGNNGPGETEAAIAALLAQPDRAPDPAFIAEIDALVQLDQAYRRQRQRAWSRFGGEAASALGLSGAAVVLAYAGGGMLAMIAAAIPVIWAATNRWATAR